MINLSSLDKAKIQTKIMEERLDFQRYLDAYQYISSNLKTKYECRDLIEQQKDSSINS